MGNCLQNAAGEFSEWNQELRRGSGAAVLTFEIGSTAEATLGGDQGEDLSKGRVDGDTSGTPEMHNGNAMINAKARQEGARLLTEFFDGKITNDEYNDAFPSGSVDAGLDVVYRRIWVYYSDLHSHYLDRQQLSEDDVALFRRCIDFLNTDLEYNGRPIGIFNSIAQTVRNLLRLEERPLSLFASEAVEASEFFTAWWPFASALEYEKAKHRP